jgi:hypothetical protein
MSKTISIPVITCAGRKGYVTLGNITYLELEGSNYWDVDDAYLHIDNERVSNFYDDNSSWKPSRNEFQDAVKKICIASFAQKLVIKNDLFRIGRKSVKIGLKNPKRIFIDMISVKLSKADALFFNEKIAWYDYRLKLSKLSILRRETIDVVEYLKCPPLGGSWQQYFTDKTWLHDAEYIKGNEIYLAQ